MCNHYNYDEIVPNLSTSNWNCTPKFTDAHWEFWPRPLGRPRRGASAKSMALWLTGGTPTEPRRATLTLRILVWILEVTWNWRFSNNFFTRGYPKPWKVWYGFHRIPQNHGKLQRDSTTGFVLDDLALVRELELSQTEAAMEVPGVGVMGKLEVGNG